MIDIIVILIFIVMTIIDKEDRLFWGFMLAAILLQALAGVI